MDPLGLGKTVRNEKAVRHNNSSIEFCRTSVALIAGATAGVLGLTGLYGFALYLVYSLVMTLLLCLKAGTKWSQYFQSSRALWFDGVVGGLFAYVLAWTFVYGMVHVF